MIQTYVGITVEWLLVATEHQWYDLQASVKGLLEKEMLHCLPVSFTFVSTITVGDEDIDIFWRFFSRGGSVQIIALSQTGLEMVKEKG